MSDISLKENSFECGGMGTINNQAPIGTPSSPDVSQNPNSFYNSNNNKAIGPYSNISKGTPTSSSLAANVNAIYAKKQVPTPDEVYCGIQQELKQMTKKDLNRAKEIVLSNLKKDIHYYSGLKSLNIDDATMMDSVNESKKTPGEQVNKSETKKIFQDLEIQKDSKFVVNSHLVNVMKEMWDAKRNRRKWQHGDPTL